MTLVAEFYLVGAFERLSLGAISPPHQSIFLAQIIGHKKHKPLSIICIYFLLNVPTDSSSSTLICYLTESFSVSTKTSTIKTVSKAHLDIYMYTITRAWNKCQFINQIHKRWHDDDSISWRLLFRMTHETKKNDEPLSHMRTLSPCVVAPGMGDTYLWHFLTPLFWFSFCMMSVRLEFLTMYGMCSL